MRIGVVILPEHRWHDGGERRWRGAEELGFAHAWTYDHLAWRDLRDESWFGAVPTLAAAAVVTTRIRLGTLVASANFRHPVPFSRDLLALDDLSAGRVTVGLGAGGAGWDATMLGGRPWPPRERTERFEELVTLLDALLTERAVTWRGRHYEAVEARSHPGCVQRPRMPFAIAATGARGMRLVARHGAAWVTTGDRDRAAPVDPETGAADVARQLELLIAACDAAGRDPSTVDRLVLLGPTLAQGLDSPDAFDEVVGCYAAVGATDLVVHWPRPAEPYAGDLARFESILAPHLGT